VGTILELVSEIRLQMLLGVSLMQSLESVLATRTDEFAFALKVWLKKLSAGQSTESIYKVLPELNATPARRSLVTVLQRGLSGSPIDSYLQELEKEFSVLLEDGFQKRMQLLPLKLLVPLTLFILPAVVLLIVGPLFLSLTSQL
jgi:pilus assembly protein TadC